MGQYGVDADKQTVGYFFVGQPFCQQAKHVDFTLPLASISLAKAARAYAFIKHRGYVIPEDVRAVAHDVLRHRVGLSYEAEASNVTSEEIVSRIINKVEVP